MANAKYLKGHDIWYERAVQSIKKKYDVKLQPVFEAFTNSLESFSEINIDEVNPQIIIRLFHSKTLIEDKYDFEYIEIEDNGLGFNEKNYYRFKMWGDDRKSSKNRGAGRVQLLHYFNSSEYTSIFKDDEGKCKERKFVLSKSSKYLKENAIIQDFGINDTKETECKTVLSLYELLNDNDKNYYNNITTAQLKKNLTSHYLPYFCVLRDKLPTVKLEQYYSNQIKDEETLYIQSEDIPEYNKTDEIVVNYSKISNDGKSIIKSNKSEHLSLKAFKISTEKLDKNAINLTVKDEIVENKNITLEHLSTKDQIDGNRYLFLLSGEYIDNIDGNTRGEFTIPTMEEFRKNHSDQTSCFEAEEILIDDIENKTNNAIVELYKEIKDKNEEKKRNIEELQKMFLLNPKTLSSLKSKININDTDNTILRKVYEADAKIIAEKDAEIKQQIEKLKELNTTDDDYEKILKEQVNEFVKAIPLQNRTALTQYVARRKLVLELFDKILKKQLEIQKTVKKNIDEKLLHNLIFQQISDNTDDSDLWLLNEDFIYFKGTSEGQLGKILIDNDTIIKNKLTQEEKEYRLKQEGDANQKRPDILLFPKEGKCIIIEFKSLDTNISDHLTQINRYASLINNLSKDNFNFTTYYGYLIGENIDTDDIQDNDSDFISAHNLNFIFRPYKRIIGKFGKNDGSLYTEVIKYSTLLERALIRNKIFIDKLDANNEK